MPKLGVKIKLEPQEAEALKKISAERQSLEEFFGKALQSEETRRLEAGRSIQLACHTKATELMLKQREIWQGIAAKHNIDLDNTSWDLAKDGENIVQIGERYVTE